MATLIALQMIQDEPMTLGQGLLLGAFIIASVLSLVFVDRLLPGTLDVERDDDDRSDEP